MRFPCGTFAQLYRHTNQTIQAYLLNCTSILMQLHQNLETIIPRCPHNYIGILINDMRVSMNDIGILIQPHQPINTIMYEWTDLYPYLPNNKKQADNRILNSYCQPIVSFYCQHVLYCNSYL